MTATRTADDEARAATTLADAIRTGVSGFVEEIVTFLLSNGIWTILVGLIAYAVVRVPAALLLTPLVAPVTCGLARVAVEVARQRVVSPRTFVAGIVDRFWTKLGLGTLHALVLLVAILDLFLAPTIGGIVGVASMVLAVYVGVSSLAYGLVFWTLLSDPDLRAMPVRQIGRLALAVVLRRPGPVAVLLLLAAMAAAVAVPLIPAVLFLPSIVLLTVAAYVTAAADDIRAGAR